MTAVCVDLQDADASSAALRLLVPGLAAAGHPVVERSAQLLRFYRTLARSEAVCTQELLARRKLSPSSDQWQHHQQVIACAKIYSLMTGFAGICLHARNNMKHTVAQVL